MAYFSDTPAPHGATKMPSRDEREKHGPYRHQPYPSTRFHPDGRTLIVANAEEDAALTKPWANKPYPPPAVVIPPPEPTVAELKAVIEKLTLDNAGLVQNISQLTDERADLKAYIADQTTEIQRLLGGGKPSKATKAAQGGPANDR